VLTYLNIELADEAKHIQNIDSLGVHLDWAERYYKFIQDYMLVQKLENFKSETYKSRIKGLSLVFDKVVTWYSKEQGNPKAVDLEKRYRKLDFQLEEEDEELSDRSEPDPANHWTSGDTWTGRAFKTVQVEVRKSDLS
jgi:hypothetical protein